MALKELFYYIIVILGQKRRHTSKMTREVTNIFFKMFTKTMLVTFPLLFYQENDFNGWTVTLFIHGRTVTAGS